MIFGSKTPLYKAREIVDSILADGSIKGRAGAVVISRKEGRRTVETGRIFFKNELVYAAEISGRRIPIAARIATGGEVDPEDLDSAVRKYGDPCDPRIVEKLLVSQLISEKRMNSYVKEHFLETISDILAWEECTGEWHPDQTTKNFVMPHVAITKIYELATSRTRTRHEFETSVRQFFKDEEIPFLTLKNKCKDPSNYSYEVQAILALSDSEHTLSQIAEQTGIAGRTTFQTTLSLWKSGEVNLKYGAIELPYASVKAAEDKRLEEEEKKKIPETYGYEEVVQIPVDEEAHKQAASEPEVEGHKPADEEATTDTLASLDENLEEAEELEDSLGEEEEAEGIIFGDASVTADSSLEDDEDEFLGVNTDEEPEADSEVETTEETVFQSENIEKSEDTVASETVSEAVAITPVAVIEEEVEPQEPETVEEQEHEASVAAEELVVASPVAEETPVVQSGPIASAPARANGKIAEFTAKLMEVQANVESLELEIHEAETECESSNKDFEERQSTLQESQSSYAKAVEAREEAERILAQVKEEEERAGENLNRLDSELEELKEYRNSASARIESLKESYGEALEEAEKLAHSFRIK